MKRYCFIENACVEDENGCGDGAYDLLDVTGDATDIAIAIAESLQETDLYSAGQMLFEDKGQDVYVNIRIRVSSRPEVKPTDYYDFDCFKKGE